jgi:tRNA threonylcarbamoyl adenosine modification protein (Sua5/YciO/YrdC/YwlC family)
MISYVVEHNPDDRVLQNAARILKSGGLIAFPTETNWVVVADPFEKKGVEKLYQLRHVENTKHFSVLCSTFQKATEIALIDDHSFALMKKVSPGPYTFILPAQKKIQKFLKASKTDHQVGLRFPSKSISRAIIEACDGIVISSHVNHQMIDAEDDGVPLYSALIEDNLGHLIDLIIDPGEYEFLGPTTIVDFTQGSPEVVRVGSGNPDLFL